MITIRPENTVKSFVEKDIRSTEVFSKFGIDFCCGSHLSLEESCKQNNVSLSKVIQALQHSLQETHEVSVDLEKFPLNALIDHIADTHHDFIHENLIILDEYLKRINNVHGSEHPELAEILSLFSSFSRNINNHLQKEENVLFPMIKKMLEAKESNTELDEEFHNELSTLIAEIQHEQDEEVRCFVEISELSQQYTTPSGACNSYQFAFKKLKEFDKNLQQYIALENQVLFPKAIA